MRKGFFSGYYVVENVLLNILGAQAFRYIVASMSLTIRRWLYTGTPNVYDKELRQNGFCVLREFLSETDKSIVLKEFEKNLANAEHSFEDGSTKVVRQTVSNLNNIENIRSRVIFNEALVNLVEKAEARRYTVKEVWLDKICNGDPETSDSQKQFHTDNFYTTHKVWYFLDDVNLSDGPLTIAKGTSRFSIIRLVFEYMQSVTYRSKNYAWRPNKFWRRLLAVRPHPVIVPANSLVVANTHAFHKRGDAEQGTTRRQVHFRIRINPMTRIFQFDGHEY